MKNTIYKYFFYEFLRYFAITIFALAVIVWTIQSVNFLDLVTEDGHAFSIYFAYSFLTLSKILTKLIPFCFLLAIILTIVKLEKDNELIILWASGLNKIYIVNLIFRISLITMLLQLIFTSTINPKLLLHVRRWECVAPSGGKEGACTMHMCPGILANKQLGDPSSDFQFQTQQSNAIYYYRAGSENNIPHHLILYY